MGLRGSPEPVGEVTIRDANDGDVEVTTDIQNTVIAELD